MNDRKEEFKIDVEKIIKNHSSENADEISSYGHDALDEAEKLKNKALNLIKITTDAINNSCDRLQDQATKGDATPEERRYVHYLLFLGINKTLRNVLPEELALEIEEKLDESVRDEVDLIDSKLGNPFELFNRCQDILTQELEGLIGRYIACRLVPTIQNIKKILEGKESKDN